MLELNLYIEDIRCISPQDTFIGQFPLGVVREYSRICTSLEPDYDKYIPPASLRRMSKLIKMAQTCAMDILHGKENNLPQAIICASGKGSLSDTETFLHEIKQYQEGALNPGPFIQSTYNAVNGAIAIQKNISGYSNMFVHRGLSLQSALIDAAVYLKENPDKKVLCGGFDEITEEHFKIKEHLGFWKSEKESCLNLESSQSEGTHAGEGASFMLLNAKQNGINLKYLQTFYNPDAATLEMECSNLFNKTNAKPDLLISGYNGDIRYKSIHENLYKKMFQHTPRLYYKKYCGDFETAIGFAIYLAFQILHYPERAKDILPNNTGKIKSILIHNSFLQKNHSLLWLEF